MIRTLSSSILILPYFLLLIVGLTVPSIAYHGIFNPKSLAFLGTLGSMLLYLFLRQQLKINQLKVIAFYFVSITFLLLWLLIGLVDDPSNVITRVDQLKLFVITLTVPTVTLFLLYGNKISTSTVFKTIIFSNLTYCTLKIGAVILHLSGIINIWSVLEAFGFRVMKMSMFGVLERLQSSLDISTPFILFFVLQSERLGFPLSRRMKIFFVIISLLSNLLAFSRFLLFVYAASLCLYLVTLSVTRIVKGILICCIALTTFIAIIGVENVSTSITQRFFSKSNLASDRTRMDQYRVLMNEHHEAPYLGKGLGSFSRDLIRDNEVKHSYEMQWIAFLMQFGLFGTSLLLIPLGMIAFRFLQYPLTRLNLSFLCVYLLWVLSGFTNPYLISLQSGIIYTLFLIAGQKHLEENVKLA
jgi:hypothetical protein